jgi:hypothetical protein
MNYPQQSAQGLASLGRYGDSMLVHMSPKEVAGLQSLAMSKGGSLTINPDTGLPEAFILDLALPVAGAFFGIPPWATAAMMAGKTLIEGGDIGSAALSAFGGYTGGKLGKSLKSFVDPIQNLPTSAVNAAANTANTAGSFIGPTGEMGSKLLSQSGGAQIGSNFGSVANEFGTNLPVEDAFKSSFKPDFGKSNFVPGFADNNLQGSFMGKDVGAPGMFQPGGANTLSTTGAPTYGPNVGAGTNIGSTISEGVSDFGNQFGTAVKNPVDFARYVGEGDALAGGAKIGMYAASPLIEGMMKPQQFSFSDPEKGKYRGPQGQLNLSDEYSSDLRLAAKGGYIDGYATGGSIQSGGIRDLYGTPDNQPTISPGLSGFGLGRLNNLAGEQAMTQAQTLGYADGGDVVAGEKGMNLDVLPSLNLNTGTQRYGDSGGSEGLEKFRTALSMAGEMNTINPGARVFSRMMSGLLSGDPEMIGMIQGKGAPSSLIRGFDDPAYANNPQWAVPAGYVPTAPAFTLNPSSGNTGAQNSAFVNRRAKGGYLNGAGDGMSDSIPATIEGKQPARLADGEFVIPADVVSHLGNGSSKAGSKRLYAMLDKVRRARTGNKKQGKQIKADKYLPA